MDTESSIDPTDQSTWSIKPTFRCSELSDEQLRFSKQLGVDTIVVQSLNSENQLIVESKEKFELDSLKRLRGRVESFGLELGAIENLPRRFYDDIVLGRNGRETQLAHLKETIQNMGEAGVPILGYNWLPNGVWRTEEPAIGRGGAKARAYDHSEMNDVSFTHGREFTEAEIWKNHEYFVEELIPVAEDAGVTLCLHPDDPPVETIGGIPRIFRNFESLKRAMNLVDSEHYGLEFCLGTISSMNHEATPLEVLRHFIEENKIVYVHFRDVEGTIPRFRELFHDEPVGNYDEVEALQIFVDSEFEGMILPDHEPMVSGESDWQPRGRAFAIGYIKGILRTLYGNVDE